MEAVATAVEEVAALSAASAAPTGQKTVTAECPIMIRRLLFGWSRALASIQVPFAGN